MRRHPAGTVIDENPSKWLALTDSNLPALQPHQHKPTSYTHRFTLFHRVLLPHRDNRHHVSWYPVNISWHLKLKQDFLSFTEALFLSFIKKWSRCGLIWFLLTCIHGNLFPACQKKKKVRMRDTTHTPVFKTLCVIQWHLVRCGWWSVQKCDWCCYMRRRKEKRQLTL